VSGRGPGAPPRRRQRGFTLIELAVTLLVLALGVALVAPAVGRSTEAIRMRAEVSRFSALLRHTREQAITTRQSHALVVNPDEHKVTIVSGEKDVRETRTLAAHLTISAQPATALTVRFEPHGVSSGGEFVVRSADIRYLVTVDPLTGRVRALRQ
jgi:general secretion pathway protein H